MRYRLQILILLNLMLSLWFITHRAHEPVGDYGDVTLSAFDELDQIEVTLRRNHRIRLVRKEDVWRVSESTLDINPQALSLLKKTLSKRLTSDQTIECKKVPCHQYGINSDSIEVSLTSKDSATTTFRLGRVVDGAYTYVQIADGRDIYRMPANLLQVFDRPMISWLDTRIFQESPQNVRRLMRRNENEVLWIFERSSPNTQWKFSSPEDADIGQQEATAVANTLVTLKAEKIIGDDLPGPYTARLEAQTFAGRSLRLDITRLKPKEYLAHAWELKKTEWRSIAPTFQIPNHQALFLMPTLDDLKNRRIFPFSAADVSTLSLRSQHEISMTRDEKYGWRMTRPQTSTTLIRHLVDDFVESLVLMRGISSPQKPPRDAFLKIQTTLDFGLKNGQREMLEVGSSFGLGGAWVRHANQENQAWVISKKALTLLSIDPNRLINKTP